MDLYNFILFKKPPKFLNSKILKFRFISISVNTKKFFVIALSFVLVFGAFTISVRAAFVDPTLPPDGGNRPAPIYETGTGQSVIGDLTITNGLTVSESGISGTNTAGVGVLGVGSTVGLQGTGSTVGLQGSSIQYAIYGQTTAGGAGGYAGVYGTAVDSNDFSGKFSAGAGVLIDGGTLPTVAGTYVQLGGGDLVSTGGYALGGGIFMDVQGYGISAPHETVAIGDVGFIKVETSGQTSIRSLGGGINFEKVTAGPVITTLATISEAGDLTVLGGDICFGVDCRSSWGAVGADSGWTDDGDDVRLTTIGNKVGIGTVTPSKKLQVVGGSTVATQILTDGYIEDVGGIVGSNYLPSHSWTLGTGSVGVFSRNGDTSENVREWGIGPYGNESILWKAINQDGDCSSGCGSRSDGGWNSSWVGVNPAKTYRLTVWIKKTNSTSGSTYFGTGGSPSYVTTLGGSANSNPYFWSGDLASLDKWYLLVGYVQSKDDANTSNRGGIYDGETGRKIRSMTDFKMQSNTTSIRHRSYLYYDTNTSNRQYWWDPRMEEVNGKEPTIEALLGSGKFATQNKTAYFGGNVGIGYTEPSTKLDIDTNSNTLGLRLRGTAGTAEIGDIYVGGGGQLILDTKSGTDTGAYIDLRPENTVHGLILRDHTGATTQWGGIRGVDKGTSDRMEFAVDSSTDYGAGLVLVQGGNIGIGTTAPGVYKLAVNGGMITTAMYDYNDPTYYVDPALTSKLNIMDLTGDVYMDNNKSIRIDADNDTNLIMGNYNDGAFAYGGTYDMNLSVEGDVKANRLCFGDADCQLGWEGIVTVGGGGQWTLNGTDLYPNLITYDVGIGTETPSSKLGIVPETGKEGLRIISSNFSPLIVRNTADSSDLFRVDQSGNTTFSGAMTGKYRGQYNSSTVVAGNWYRIAQNTAGGKRANAEFTLRDNISGGGHSSLTFRAGISYNYATGMSFTVVNHHYYGTPTFTKVRIIENGTYDSQYLEVYLNRPGSVNYSIYDNFSSGGWEPVDWTAGSIPSGYTSREFDVNKLFVVGDYDDRFTINRGGKIGIGTTDPATKLDIDTNSNALGLRLRGTAGTAEIGDIYVGSAGNLVLDTKSGTDTGRFIDFRPEDDVHGLIIRDHTGVTTEWGGIRVVDNGTSDRMEFAVDSSTDYGAGLVLVQGGNIGIGTTDPGAYKLAVNGGMITTAIYDYNDPNYYVDPALTSKLNIMDLTGDIYMVNENSIRIDADSDTNLIMGNYNDGVFAYGGTYDMNLAVEGSVKANEFCIGDADCKSSWTSIGGASGWTDGGTTVSLTTITDSVELGQVLNSIDATALYLNTYGDAQIRIDADQASAPGTNQFKINNGANSTMLSLDETGEFKVNDTISAQNGKYITHLPWYNIGANFTGYLKLITPIVHNESNMFTIKITGYEYGHNGGNSVDIRCGGYAYGGSSLIQTRCYTEGTDLPVEIDKEDRGGTQYVVIRLGTPTYASWYYSHFTAEYIGWKAKDPDSFSWVEAEITPSQIGNTNLVYINDEADIIRLNDGYIQNVKGFELKDWDDDTGGTDSKYRLLARDGAFQFYNGGVVVGNYPNSTWTDLVDGRLIVEGSLGISTTDPGAYKLAVNGGIITTVMYDYDTNYYVNPDETSKLNIMDLTGDVYVDNNKSIRIDADSDTNLIMGNYNDGVFAYGGTYDMNLAVEGDVQANRLCIGDNGTPANCMDSWASIGGTSGWTDDGGNVRLTTINDKVGIGTITPEASLHSIGESAAIINNNSTLTYTGGGKMYTSSWSYSSKRGGGGGYSGAQGYGGVAGGVFLGGNGSTSYGGGGAGIVAIGGDAAGSTYRGGGGAGIYAKAGITGSLSDGIVAGGYFDGNGLNSIIAMNGNVGIGNTNPGYELDVTGDARVTGDLTVEGMLSGGADVAEEFKSEFNVPAGTVMVMGDDGYRSAIPSSKEYDQSVIGVVSDNAGLTMGRVKGPNKSVIALVGVVKVKVVGYAGEIKKGDLLTTSNIEGYAMKAIDPKIGTVIGKALESFEGDRGEIMVLINLQ